MYRCDMKYMLLEMDRILRPDGYAIIRESSYLADAISTIAKGMRWSCNIENTEDNIEKERILICQKKLWYPSNQNSRWWLEQPEIERDFIQNIERSPIADPNSQGPRLLVHSL